MENSYDEECFKKWEIDECEAEMEKVVQWIGKRKLHGRVRVAFIEESYERQGYIYFTSLLYRELPEGAQRKILNLCLEAGGEYYQALFEFVTTDAGAQAVCLRHHLSPSVLERAVRRYYEAFPRKI